MLAAMMDDSMIIKKENSADGLLLFSATAMMTRQSPPHTRMKHPLSRDATAKRQERLRHKQAMILADNGDAE